jgi:UDP-2,4-diacetamido-2,4,6-trideoxy-beta-L-altropyranose hydrolase
LGKKTILFRADGNIQTGLGHLYRLFALVEMLKDTYTFFYITKENSVVNIIPEDYNLKIIPLEVPLLEEAEWLSKHFDSQECILISDGYQFKSNYQKNIKEKGFKHIYIDDLEAYTMFADIIVNHSSGAKKENYNTIGDSHFAIGTDYALLRPHFLEEAKRSKKAPETFKEVFVCFGGADKFQLAASAIEELVNIETLKRINVVVGAASKDEKLIELQTKHKGLIHIYKNLSEVDLLNLMKQCQLAIVPTSTIFYEIACVKIPTISGYFVDNQIGVYNYFNDENCFYGVGDFNEFQFKSLPSLIDFVKLNAQEYIDMQSKVIDGKQKSRFLNLLEDLN